MKAIRCLLLLVLLGITGSLSAAYLEYVPQKLIQPNGAVINCFASGDEYYHWLHDANGFTIIQNRETGYFVYADKSGDDLIPTLLLPGVDDPSAAGLRPGLNISTAKYREYFASRFKEPSMKSARSFSNTGDYNNLVIFVRFSNQNEYAEPLTQYSTAFNGAGTVSLTEYFKEVSKTQLNISTTFYPKPNGTIIISYQDSHSRKYYQPYSGANPDGYRTSNESTNREMTLLKNASEFVSVEVIASGVNYDHDNDGNIDNVCFIVEGPTDGWSDLLWPHQWVLYTYDVRIGDKRVYHFNFQLSEALGVSVLCHEMFHSLGAPDLYRYVNDNITPVGPWDLMSHNKTPPQHMGAYMKMKYGKWFSQIPTITSDGTYTLKPLASDGYASYKILSPNSTSEYFVVEYRKAAGRFESSIVGSGLIIYRVNQSLDGNSQGPPDEVYVYRQNGTSRSDGNINNATFSSSVGRTDFGDNTSPSDFLSDGTAGGIHIFNIGAIGETITFTVGTGGALNPPRELTANLAGRNITLTWQKPETGSGTLAGYKVFRNGAAISTINNPNTLTFSESGLADGSYQYHVTARYSSPSGESGPSNTVTVDVSSEAKPDLIITNPTVEPANVEPGGTINVTCKLENQGTTQAGSSMLRIYLSQDEIFDSGDRQLASDSMDPLDAGATKDVTGQNIQVPSNTNVGNWFVIFLADADGTVNESIENNNQASAPLTIGNPALNPPRNLVAQVSPATVKLSWTEPEPGGGMLAGYYIYRNSVKIGFIDNPSTVEYSDNGLALGTYTYYLTASYSNPLGESSKSNEVQVTLSNDTKPDLTLQNFEVTPLVSAPGGSLKMTCTLLNIGGAQAPSNLVQLYLSKDLNIDSNDILLAYGTIDPLNAGDNISISGADISLPATLGSGNWYALIMADADNQIDETNETNNTAFVSIVIQGETPDLQLIGISFYPLVIVPGTNFRVTITISNGGNTTASPVKVSLFLSKDETLDDSDLKLFDESTRLLGAKGTIQLSSGFTLQPNFTPGQYFLIGKVDPDGVVAESDESNNQFVKSVIVTSTTGTDDILLSKDLHIYPNPATGFINIDFNGRVTDKTEIEIFNGTGTRVYYEKIVPNGSLQLIIPVNQFDRGFYTLRMRNDGNVFYKKIVFQ